MDTQKRKIAAVVAGLVVLVTCLASADKWNYGSADMNSLLQGSAPIDSKSASRYHNEAERQEWLERNWRFAHLWMARREKDVVPEITPFLEDSDEDLREHAARALGRLEDARAEAPLQHKLEQVQKVKSSADYSAADYEDKRMIPEQTLRLALGRIKARDLEGKAKLNKVAESVDLTYNGVVYLAQKINAQYKSENPSERRQAGEGRGTAIVLEIVDVLYTMGKKGENIADFEPMRLAFGPAIAMKLKAATLPLDQEIQLILDYTAQPTGGAFDPAYLVDLGPRATEMIIQRLEDMHRNPQRYNLSSRAAVGPTYLFKAAGMTADPRVVPLLQQLATDFKSAFSAWESNPNKTLENWNPSVSTYGSARQAQSLAEEKLDFPILPAY